MPNYVAFNRVRRPTLRRSLLLRRVSDIRGHEARLRQEGGLSASCSSARCCRASASGDAQCRSGEGKRGRRCDHGRLSRVTRRRRDSLAYTVTFNLTATAFSRQGLFERAISCPRGRASCPVKRAFAHGKIAFNRIASNWRVRFFYAEINAGDELSRVEQPWPSRSARCFRLRTATPGVPVILDHLSRPTYSASARCWSRWYAFAQARRTRRRRDLGAAARSIRPASRPRRPSRRYRPARFRHARTSMSAGSCCEVQPSSRPTRPPSPWVPTSQRRLMPAGRPPPA